MVVVLCFTVVNSGRAWAVCVPDADADGYPATPSFACPLVDCDDTRSGVNPGVYENLDTPEDDNCNQRTGLWQLWQETNFPASSWADVGSVSHGPDGVNVGSVSSAANASSTRAVVMPLSTSVAVALRV